MASAARLAKRMKNLMEMDAMGETTECGAADYGIWFRVAAAWSREWVRTSN